MRVEFVATEGSGPTLTVDDDGNIKIVAPAGCNIVVYGSAQKEPPSFNGSREEPPTGAE